MREREELDNALDDPGGLDSLIIPSTMPLDCRSCRNRLITEGKFQPREKPQFCIHTTQIEDRPR